MGLSPIRLFCRKYALLLFNPNIHIFIKKVKEKHLGYHIQTGNRDNFFSLDFGLLEFAPGEIRSVVTSELHWANMLDVKERMERYRRYLYEAGALDNADRGTAPEEYAPQLQVNCTGQA